MFSAFLATMLSVQAAASPAQGQVDVKFEMPEHVYRAMERTTSHPVLSLRASQSYAPLGFTLNADEAAALLRAMAKGYEVAGIPRTHKVARTPPKHLPRRELKRAAIPAKLVVYFSIEDYIRLAHAFGDGRGVTLDTITADCLFYTVAGSFGMASSQQLTQGTRRFNADPDEPLVVRDLFVPGGVFTAERDWYGHELWFNPQTNNYYYYWAAEPTGVCDHRDGRR